MKMIVFKINYWNNIKFALKLEFSSKFFVELQISVNGISMGWKKNRREESNKENGDMNNEK